MLMLRCSADLLSADGEASMQLERTDGQRVPGRPAGRRCGWFASTANGSRAGRFAGGPGFLPCQLPPSTAHTHSHSEERSLYPPSSVVFLARRAGSRQWQWRHGWGLDWCKEDLTGTIMLHLTSRCVLNTDPVDRPFRLLCNCLPASASFARTRSELNPAGLQYLSYISQPTFTLLFPTISYYRSAYLLF
jgi:hypothetical protein